MRGRESIRNYPFSSSLWNNSPYSGWVTTSPPLGPRAARGDRPRLAALRVLRTLAAATEPLTVSDLVAELGGHPNTARLHLGALVDAGFVVEVASRVALPGRPARRFEATVTGSQVAFEDPGRDHCAALVAAISDLLSSGPAPRPVARALGAAWGRHLMAAHDGPADLVAALAGQGFAPETTAWGIRLRTCPLLAEARTRPEVVCGIHQGLVDALSPAPLSLVPFAEPGACLIRPVGVSAEDAGVDG